MILCFKPVCFLPGHLKICQSQAKFQNKRIKSQNLEIKFLELQNFRILESQNLDKFSESQDFREKKFSNLMHMLKAT